MYSKQNLIFALFFLSPLTEHTNTSLTLSFPLPLEFFLSYSFAHSHHRILLLILITELFCSFSSPREIKCDRFAPIFINFRSHQFLLISVRTNFSLSSLCTTTSAPHLLFLRCTQIQTQTHPHTYTSTQINQHTNKPTQTNQ